MFRKPPLGQARENLLTAWSKNKNVGCPFVAALGQAIGRAIEFAAPDPVKSARFDIDQRCALPIPDEIERLAEANRSRWLKIKQIRIPRVDPVRIPGEHGQIN